MCVIISIVGGGGGYTRANSGWYWVKITAINWFQHQLTMLPLTSSHSHLEKQEYLSVYIQYLLNQLNLVLRCVCGDDTALCKWSQSH